MTGTEELAQATRAIDGLASTAEAHHAKVDEIRGSKMYADAHVRSLTQTMQSEFVEGHAAGRQAAAGALDAAERAAGQYLSQPGDEATEIRKGRAAIRVSRLIDGGKSAEVAAEMFAEDGDVDALRALRDEVPSWVTQTLPPSERHNRRIVIDRTLLSIDRLMAPLLTGKAAAAANVRIKVADERNRLDAVSEHALANTAMSRIKLAYAG